MNTVFEAKFRGNECENCEEIIKIGDRVQFIEGDTLVHEECTKTPARPAEVCTSCWLTKPCECEEA